MTQRQRVLAALEQAGDRGITSVDFLRFPTIDGGAPITRVAARIQELRDDGYVVSSSGTRDRCALYVLKGQAVSDEPRRDDAPMDGACHAIGDSADGSSETATLFDPAALQLPAGAYDEIDEAA